MSELKAGFDLMTTVRSIACVLALLFLALPPVEEALAAGDVAIYSALGDPLVAEIVLLPQEQGASRFVIREQTESGQQFEVERIEQRSALLLLSDTPVEQPILKLSLLSGEVGTESDRALTLFLDPLPAGSASTYLRGLVIERNRALEQSSQLVRQQQSRDTPSGWMEQLFFSSKRSAFSSWSFFLLLGGVAALLLVWWWRSAEPMSLELAADSIQDAGHSPSVPLSAVEGEEGVDHSGIWREFRRGVEQIEQEIQPPPAGAGR